ncbi:MAG: UDP-glucose/GDP-mannose dehydrogenase family protein [Candidatus Delongbacteria bacterium]|nr:UDP-glucose/GDP-mannose dehydrogenase family protein [Candidatus Delongbacteria bacterium]MBN2836504.1 UDP-glucose/GDP-mannose dehydrogenase family protein [Candidatus Delongbacteria bacterium]
MRLSVVGTGYVGLVTGACLAEVGNDVICVDTDTKKIENLHNGILPIYEPGLEKYVDENYKKGNLKFTIDINDALENSEILFIAVGTPMGEDGSADLQYVLAVAESIGKGMKHHMIIVDKSTVPIGTGDKVKARIQEVLNSRNSDLTFDIVSNPEFLKEGAAVDDFMKPDRVVVGADNNETMIIMRDLYSPFLRNHDRFVAMDIRSAEMTKYAANSMLATKISFMNEISRICEKVGADVNMVRIGIGSDTRIGYSFIYPGCGYGGSCFPKDVQALIKIAEENDVKPELIRAVESVNFRQKLVLVEKITNRFGEDLSGLTFGVWGLAFKPETDDMRAAPAITIIKELLSRGAKVKAYDPQAVKEAKECYLKGIEIEYVKSKYDALTGSDAMVLITEWKEFRSPDFSEMKLRLKNPIIFDGRNQYRAEKLKDFGFEYHQIGV